ncbi:MAG: 50S ribosomal protein L21 [Alphaproteobacteria bacterium]|nr:50S ribosomal protein L21 [Alphaproteobacteria bacterium]
MFAIFKSGGKQYKVEKGDILALEKLDAEKNVVFDEVLMVDEKIGEPFIKGATVSADVVEHSRADKVIIFKKKKRHNYRRKLGHKQHQTVVKITDIKG